MDNSHINVSKIRKYHEAKMSARASRKEQENRQTLDSGEYAMKENIHTNVLPHLNKKFLVKGMHLVQQIKAHRESERRQALSELSTVQRTLDSRVNILENALSIVERHRNSLAPGQGRRGGMSSLERNRIALGLMKQLKRQQESQSMESLR